MFRIAHAHKSSRAVGDVAPRLTLEDLRWEMIRPASLADLGILATMIHGNEAGGDGDDPTTAYYVPPDARDEDLAAAIEACFVVHTGDGDEEH